MYPIRPIQQSNLGVYFLILTVFKGMWKSDDVFKKDFYLR